MATELNQTTISAALDDKATSIKVASVTNRLKGDLMVIDTEVMLLNENPDTNNAICFIQRGYAGTRAVAHASGQVAIIDRAARFRSNLPKGKVTASEVPYLPAIVIGDMDPRAFRYVNDSWVEVSRSRVVNHECVDPDTGYVYLLVDCQNAFQVGEWAVIDPDGLATQVGATSKGRVGIIVETITASDTYSFVLIVGKYASALTTSDVTTAADMIAVTGAGELLSSTGGNIIWRAVCTVVPSTATSPSVGGAVATVYIDRPFVSADVHSFSSVGT